MTPFGPLLTANRSPHQCSGHQLTAQPPSLSTVPPARVLPPPYPTLDPAADDPWFAEEATEEALGKAALADGPEPDPPPAPP
jgi:hypothetical protein